MNFFDSFAPADELPLERPVPVGGGMCSIFRTIGCVGDSLASGENVYLRGFGSFIIKVRSEKTARNISAKTTIIIPEHKIPAFKPARVFMDEVKNR